MIPVDINTRTLVNDIDYRHKVNQIPILEDVYSLLELINTRDIPLTSNTTKHLPYWELLHTILDNIGNGKRNLIPGLAAMYGQSKEAYWLSPSQIDAENKRYQEARKKLIQNLGLNPTMEKDSLENQLKLHWLRNHNGFFDMLETAKICISYYQYFN